LIIILLLKKSMKLLAGPSVECTLQKKKYLEDYLHKLTLHVLGFENNQHRVRIMARSNDVILKIRSTSEDLDESMKQIGLTT